MTAPAKILVVDDTPHNVKLLADLLTARGYAVVTAASGAEALRLVEEERPDLVLPDVVMPGMSGYEVCQRLRTNPATGVLPVVMVNDPVPVADHAARAVRMALAMRDGMTGLAAKWRKRGYELDIGVGIANGYATIGAIGFEGRWDYGAIGTVTNLAFRLCGEARPGQILVSGRVLGTVEGVVEVEPVGALPLKGFTKPVPVFSLLRLKSS